MLPPPLRAVSPSELAERLEAERSGEAFLLYLDPGGRQRIVRLAERAGPLSIGRTASNDIALEGDDEVSRVHAMLEPIGSEWTVVDDGLSRNGTYVNGARVRGRRRLADGDAIAVGGSLILFAGADQPGATTHTTRHAAPPELSAARRRVLFALCRPLFDDPFAGPPSNREIAADLVVSVETVKSHMHALFELFEVEDMPQNRKRSELVRRAFQRGALNGLE
jgi:pSer/pThr/pTyr-binding forkhead associated (FHA) protein